MQYRFEFRPGIRRGIALREVAIIAVLAMALLMMLLMWLGRARSDGSRILCERRQQQTAAALLQYEALHEHYPGFKNLQAVDAEGERQPTGWVFGLLPLLGYDVPLLEQADRAALRELAEDPDIKRPYAALFEQYGPEGPAATRGATPRQRIEALICPASAAQSNAAQSNAAQSNSAQAEGGRSQNPLTWVVNTGMPDAKDYGPLPADWTANGMFENQFDPGAAQKPRINAEWLLAHDGLASTLMLSENVDADSWTNTAESLVGFVWVAEVVGGRAAPGDRLLRINELRGQRGATRGEGAMRFARPSGFHVGGVNVVYASGKTQFMNEGINWLVFARLMSSDGENAKLPGTQTPAPEIYR